MDLKAYKLLQRSEWIRQQLAGLEAGIEVECPVEKCDGRLERYEMQRAPDDVRVGIPTPAGVKCPVCRAESRPVAL